MSAFVTEEGWGGVANWEVDKVLLGFAHHSPVDVDDDEVTPPPSEYVEGLILKRRC